MTIATADFFKARGVVFCADGTVEAGSEWETLLREAVEARRLKSAPGVCLVCGDVWAGSGGPSRVCELCEVAWRI